MSAAPLLTVGMPVYNAGIHLRPAVMSIVRQTFTDWELLLMDDGSTDGALDGLADLADSRIRIVRDGQNRGIAVRLNQAIGLARGSYFARMDADDVSFQERFALQLARLQSDRGLDLLATRAITVDRLGQATGNFPFARSHRDICSRPWRGFHFPHPTWMGRTEWFRTHRYAVPAPYLCEDQELLLRTHGCSRFATLDAVLLAYRVKGTTDWGRLREIRRSTLRCQLQHMRLRGHWGFAALAWLSWLAKTGRDAWQRLTGRPPAARSAAVSAETLRRWQAALRAATEQAPMP